MVQEGATVELIVDCLDLLGRIYDKKINASDWPRGGVQLEAPGNDITRVVQIGCCDAGKGGCVP
jgi:hypothetical protein